MNAKRNALPQAVHHAVNSREGLILIDHHNGGYAESLYELMNDSGQLDRLKIVRFDQPELSNTYNLFGSVSVRAGVEQASKHDPHSKTEFWTEVASFTLTTATLALALQPGQPAFNTLDVLALLSDFELLLDYVKRIHADESEDHQRGLNWLNASLNHWHQDGAWNVRQYKALTAGLAAKIAVLTHEAIAQVINTYTPDVNLTTAQTEGQIVVFSLSALGNYQSPALFEKLLISDIQAGAINVAKMQRGESTLALAAPSGEIAHLEPEIFYFQRASASSTQSTRNQCQSSSDHKSQTCDIGVNAWAEYLTRNQELFTHHVDTTIPHSI